MPNNNSTQYSRHKPEPSPTAAIVHHHATYIVSTFVAGAAR
jgi:hypothetical protein